MATSVSSAYSAPNGKSALENGHHMSVATSPSEKTMGYNACRSTPDSEVLASSDEDQETSSYMPASMSSKRTALPKPTRRLSANWTADVQSANPRRNSTVQERGPWRLSQLAQSPGGSSTAEQDETLAASSINPEQAIGGIPFAFSLQPIYKTKRSSSYSVGQTDDELVGSLFQRRTAPTAHRTSVGLGLVQEDDYECDLESFAESDPSVKSHAAVAKSSQPFDAAPNPLLKRATIENARVRHPSSDYSVTSSGNRVPDPDKATSRPSYNRNSSLDTTQRTTGGGSSVMHQLRNEVEAGLTSSSEHVEPVSPFDTPLGRTGDWKLERPTQKQQWQSSLGLGGFGDGQQSRRHSLASVPTRTRTSISVFTPTEEERIAFSSRPPRTSFGQASPQEEDRIPSREYQSFRHVSSKDLRRLPPEDLRLLSDDDLRRVPPADRVFVGSEILQAIEAPYRAHDYQFAASYFSGHGPASRALGAGSMASYGDQPETNPYVVPSVITRTLRRLYVVEFKCARADIYYIPDNTGLEVRVGDMVVVEGDRGTDLGTVIRADVTMKEAKEYKAEANRQHLNWLMMFSRTFQSSENGAIDHNGAFAGANGEHGVARGIGPREPEMSGRHHPDDTKLRMIKRRAENHEIVCLRDKEGNEARAKRCCQNKVRERNLPMEILDAEFQMWVHHFVRSSPSLTDTAQGLPKADVLLLL